MIFHGRLAFFFTATNILLTFISWAGWQHRFYITKIGNGRKDRLEGYAPFCFNFFFLQTIFAQLTPLFYLYLHLKPILRSVSFSDTGSLDRDIIFRDRTYRVFCFLGWVVKFRAREANSRWRSASSNPDLAIEFVFFFTFLLSFFSFLFFLPSFRIFHDQTHTLSIKGSATRREKAERRQRAIRFTRFVDYRLMFDSGRSFSLKYDLIHSPD